MYIANEVIITYGLHPFDICTKNPELWNYIKIAYIFTFIFSNIIISNFIYSRFFCKFNFFNPKEKKISQKNNKHEKDKTKLQLLIGYDKNKKCDTYIPESGLYQNFLITGTIGSGKTSSAMYPFTKQLLEYNSNNPSNKIGI